MSEAELIESIQLAIGNAVSTYAVFWTLVGGYLVAVFMGPSGIRASARKRADGRPHTDVRAGSRAKLDAEPWTAATTFHRSSASLYELA